MRRSIQHTLLWLTLLSSPATPRLADASSPYEDFRLPEVHTRTFRLSQGMSLSSALSSSGSDPIGSSRQRGALGLVESMWSRTDESDARSCALRLDARAGWSSRSQVRNSTGAGFLFDDQQDNDEDAYSAGALLQHGLYTHDSKWGVEAVGTASYTYRRVETGSRSLERFPPVEDRRERTNRFHDYRGTGGLELHAGRGRIRDVTGVLSALALEQRLLRMKRLSGPLRDETREQLAQLFTVGSDFATVHDEPARAFWREVAAILERDGALLQGGLDAEGLERVQEALAPSGRLTLRHGTRLAVVTRLDRMAGHLDEDSHEHFQRTGAGNVDVEFTIVESRRTTVDESLSRYGLEFDLTRSRGVVATYQLHAEMLHGSGVWRSLDWRALAGCERLLLDRWYVALSAEHLSSSIRAGGGRSEPTWGVVLGGRLSYRLEDHWSVDLSSNHEDLMIRSSLFSLGIPTIAGRRSSSALRLGFSWRPSGRFDSPTLGIHERAISVER